MAVLRNQMVRNRIDPRSQPYASGITRVETGLDPLTRQLLFGLDGRGGFIPGAMRAAEKVFFEAGAEIVPITLKPLPNNFWSSALFILEHEFFIGLNEYLKKSKSSMENMASIVEFNNANKKETMDFYGQEYFLSSIAAGPGKKIEGKK